MRWAFRQGVFESNGKSLYEKFEIEIMALDRVEDGFNPSGVTLRGHLISHFEKIKIWNIWEKSIKEEILFIANIKINNSLK